MELFIIRHGQSANNALEDPSKREQDPPLTSLGEKQADHLAAFIAKGRHLSLAERSTDRPYFDRLYCSAMRRAMQTVRPVGEILGIVPEVWIDIHETGGIFLDHGKDKGTVGYGGMTDVQVQQDFPGYIIPSGLGEGGWWNPARGKEEPHEGYGRAIGVAKVLQEWASVEQRIGIVVHGDFMSILIKVLGQQIPGYNIDYVHDNTSITRIDFQSKRSEMSQDSMTSPQGGGRMRIRYINRVHHLADELIS